MSNPKSPEKIIEDRNAVRAIPIFKAIFILHTILILTVDAFNYFMGYWETDIAQYYLFLNRLCTLPFFLLLVYLNKTYYLKKRALKFNLAMTINALGLAPYIWTYYYIELSHYQSTSLMLIYISAFCVITRIPRRKMNVLTSYFVILYYGLLWYVGISYQDNISAYIHGITVIFIFHRVAIKLYKQDLADVKRELLLKEKQKKLDDLNHQLQDANTEIKLQNYKLSKSNDDLSNFAYIAAHDLKSPLGTISNFVSLLAEKYKTNINQEDFKIVAFITSACTDLQQIIDNLLDFSKIANKSNEKLNRVDLDELLERCQVLLQNRIKIKNATINVTHQIPQVYGLQPLLLQLFMNLISNAIKFSKSDTPPIIDISYTIDASQKWLKMSIKDNGIGIAKEHQEEIFQLFKKLNPSSEYEGSGIGLATCLRIVEIHGGSIEVESTEGLGSMFTFTLPLEKKALLSTQESQE